MSPPTSAKWLGTERASLIATGVAAIFGIVAATLAWLVEPRASVRITPADVAYQAGQIDALAARFAQLQREQRQLTNAAERAPQNVGLEALLQRLDSLEKKQVRIEQAILSSPEKALEVPLLRHDFDSFKEGQAQQISAVKSTVDQVYDLNKWLLGAMAISIVGLALTRLLSLKSG